MGVRRKARESGLQLLYHLEAHVQSVNDRENPPGTLKGAEACVEHVIDVFFENFKAPEKIRSYAETLVRGVANHHDDLDEAIKSCSPNWRLERMTMVDRSVLRMAAFELAHESEVPTRVIIDEAVEIAKRYGSEKSSAFVNGVVDALATKSRSA